MFHMPSGMQLVVIMVVILLLFGGKKIPELAKGLGSGIKNFKKAISDDDTELQADTKTVQTKNEERKI
ncbi:MULTISPECIES: Sec-independent protein translocase subunit TatA/TatB [Arcobacter]|uniref:Sec-independent protein translocase protein TatA n=1 Tax=Arcobacter ellisii TaxID=913109 RepID=A0A347U7L7_9BACT|nr:twin-arginine translocase TatA/TatE family subunit [Arcobacter ellisii]AXX94845.1 twin arginine translocation system, TatA/E family protein [Arcobacter ellisii]RXI30557.1 twin-arginine translocase TatA/TatE family subunit [Arcobacter ellisii]